MGRRSEARRSSPGCHADGALSVVFGRIVSDALLATMKGPNIADGTDDKREADDDSLQSECDLPRRVIPR